MRFLINWLCVCLIIISLQACCSLGGQRSTISKGTWEHKENATYSSVNGSVQFDRCTKITRQHCADKYTEICKTIDSGQQIKAMNPSTGEDISAAANDMYEAQCAKLKTNPKQIDDYCETNSNDDCMKENGFVYKYHDVSQCSPMKLF